VLVAAAFLVQQKQSPLGAAAVLALVPVAEQPAAEVLPVGTAGQAASVELAVSAA